MIIKRNKPNIYVNGNTGLIFYPGVNFIPSDKIEAAKKDKMLNELLENGVHELIHEDKPNKKVKSPEPIEKKSEAEIIKGLNVNKAIKVIQDIANIKILEKIKETDLRVGIQKAIDDQIDKIDSYGKQKE